MIDEACAEAIPSSDCRGRFIAAWDESWETAAFGAGTPAWAGRAAASYGPALSVDWQQPISAHIQALGYLPAPCKLIDPNVQVSV